jgi:predicted lipoprotein with Yx(FWY)xxD motif
VLVDGKGHVLYAFEPDAATTVTCTFTCASNWPPLAAAEGASPAAGEGIDPGLLGTLPDPAGGEVVTYNGWPLYRYAADKVPGAHRGHDITLNGGAWYVMTPGGEPLRP